MMTSYKEPISKWMKSFFNTEGWDFIIGIDLQTRDNHLLLMNVKIDYIITCERFRYVSKLRSEQLQNQVEWDVEMEECKTCPVFITKRSRSRIGKGLIFKTNKMY